MGKTPDELTPRQDYPSHVREEPSNQPSGGTTRQIGGIEWQPSEPASEVGASAQGTASTTPRPATSSGQHDERRRDDEARQDDEHRDEALDAFAEEEIAEISGDIEQTRAELSETIDAIQARLAPQHLVEQAREAALDASTNLVEETKSALMEATIGKAELFFGRAEQMVNDFEDTARDTGESLIDTVKANPLPAALAALSIGYLMRRRGQRSRNRHVVAHRPDSWAYSEHAYEDHGQFHERGATQVHSHGSMGTHAHTGTMGHDEYGMRDRAGDMVGSARDTIGDVASNATGVASDAADRVIRVASNAGSTAADAGSDFWDMIRRNPVPAAMAGLGIAWLMMNREETRFHPMHTVASVKDNLPVPPVDELTDRARSQIDDLSSTAQDKVYGAQSQFGSILDDSPLAIGAIALGVGAAIGLAVPTTSRERELLGDARETLMERTQEVAQQAQERLLHVAESVQDTAKDELQNQFQSDQGTNTMNRSGQVGQTSPPPTSGSRPETRAS